MTVLEKLEETREEMESIGELIYEVDEIADNLVEFIQGDTSVFEKDGDAIQGLEVLKDKMDDINIILNGEEI